MKLTRFALALSFALSFGRSQPVLAASPPCLPCAGVEVTNPDAVAAALAELPALAEGARLYVLWNVDAVADRSEIGHTVSALTASRATPWIRVVFHTPSPIAEHLAELEEELKGAAALARAAAPTNHYQILWRPEVAAPAETELADYAFLLKRAAVAISGAQTDARILSRALPADSEVLRSFYANEVAAYLDGVALEAAGEEGLVSAIQTLTELDPGRPVVVEDRAPAGDAAAILAATAETARRGAAVATFTLDTVTTDALRPLIFLANEFAGDLSFDPYSLPTGAAGAWPFVRGKDLGLRVVAQPSPGAKELVLRFNDPQLRRPMRIDPATGEAKLIAGVGQTSSGLELRIPSPRAVELLRIERASAAEIGEGAVAESVEVASEREIPVEEILRRLQAFEDAQSRKLDHYEATNTTHLRFQATGGAGTVEATLAGDFFFRRGQGYDWAWQSLFFNGVRWRGKTLPEIPLVQPEKAATMPLNIELSKRYDYRLRGSQRIGQRDCWEIEFRPVAEAQAEAEKLFRGTVWVDKQIYARVQTRAVQLGLEGEVLSNEETVSFAPVDTAGQPGAWSAESYFLPLRTVSQQLWSVINTTTVVEREILLTNVRLNTEQFEANRQAALASDATMVRDTPQGMRYLVKEEGTTERVVKEGFDTDKLFLIGGVFYDDSLDFPLPLAGINYFSFDFKGTGNQLNAFFGGALATVDFAQPRAFGTKFDLGADAFVFAFPTSDQLFRNEEEAPGEEVRSITGNVSVLAGHPIGNFVKIETEYELTFDKYKHADDTDDAFVLPQDTLTHTFKLDASFARAGYRLALEGNYNRRQDWDFWGLPGNTEFSRDQRDYLKWSASAAKSWHLPKFQRITAELDAFGGEDLDRFSKYQFGFFGGQRVHGFQGGKVRAEEGYAAHLTYGFQVGDVFRLEGVGDVAWATDEASGLENEQLAGLGIVGQFMGPWQTLVQVDVGVPVAGPDDGFVAYIVFLKLFK